MKFSDLRLGQHFEFQGEQHGLYMLEEIRPNNICVFKNVVSHLPKKVRYSGQLLDGLSYGKIIFKFEKDAYDIY